MNYTTNSLNLQEADYPLRLADESTTGRKRPWREKKIMNEKLAKAYEAVDYSKAERLRNCSQHLRFRIYDDGSRHLIGLDSCRVRLCPLCSWRRSLKAFYNTNQIATSLAESKNYRYIMLTLTIKNCAGEDLSKTIDQLFEAFNRFMLRTRIKKAVAGWMRTLEVTHNIDPKSPSYDTYHPHFHILLCVPPTYFKHRYISQKDWRDMWKQAARLDYDPEVNVQAIKKSARDGLISAIEDKDLQVAAISDAVGEVSKYSAKPEDYIIDNDWDLTVDAVATLDQALANRRLIAYGGVMREEHRRLHLDDEESGDLARIGEDLPVDEAYRIVDFFWFAGAREYRGRARTVEPMRWEVVDGKPTAMKF